MFSFLACQPVAFSELECKHLTFANNFLGWKVKCTLKEPHVEAWLPCQQTFAALDKAVRATFNLRDSVSQRRVARTIIHLQLRMQYSQKHAVLML